MYFASILTEIEKYHLYFLGKINLPLIAMSFFDADPIESFTMQYLNNRVVLTITNQHGYPIYRSKEIDRLNQCQILNLSSQYYFAKGDFTKQQFINAGIPEERIIVVGSMVNKRGYRCGIANTFAVFLDTPALYFNKKMIEMAEIVSKNLNMNYIVKMHPADKHMDRYTSMINPLRGKILIGKANNEEIYKVIDFAIIHASAMYIDLIMADIKTYRYEKEDTPCNPTTPYGISKNALRELTAMFCKQKNKLFQWLRGYYIVGNSKYGSSIFSKITTAESEGKEEFPFTMGQNQFDFIDYEDFCEQVARTVGQYEVLGVINICSGSPEKLADRVECFIKENDYKIKLRYGAFPDRPYVSKVLWGDSRKIEEVMKK